MAVFTALSFISMKRLTTQTSRHIDRLCWLRSNRSKTPWLLRGLLAADFGAKRSSGLGAAVSRSGDGTLQERRRSICGRGDGANDSVQRPVTLNALQVEQMVSTVQLVQALGGGWDRSQLVTTKQVGAKVANADYKMQQ